MPDDIGPVHVRAIVAPGSHHQITRFEHFQNPGIILRPNGVCHKPQCRRVGGTVGEQIGHQQPPKAPSLGKIHAAPNRWVILSMICGGGIESNKQHTLLRWSPDSL